MKLIDFEFWHENSKGVREWIESVEVLIMYLQYVGTESIGGLKNTKKVWFSNLQLLQKTSL